MNKLVVLKFGKGSFENGFPIVLQIGEENSRPHSEVMGDLPPNPELPLKFNYWQTIYCSLDFSARPIGIPKPVSKVAKIEECTQAAEELRDRLNFWLQSESFRPIREKWLEKLLPGQTIRVIFQTEDYQLQKLPWHLWDLIERYPNAEIAVSAPSYDRVNRFSTLTKTVKILAILGNSAGIDIETDRTILEQLPEATVNFLVEPERKDLSDSFWKQNWDILFFAGHSSSLGANDNGNLYINQTESLTITQLKYALKNAVAHGLKLAIFNSCDGLGLARELASLHIPQLIVMREPVPDRVAQTFLKHFLEAYAGGKPLYLAVREARERLQGLEGQFPCATWLPVIYQNPAEVPSTWRELLEQNPENESASDNFLHSQTLKSPNPYTPLFWLGCISLAIASLVMGVRYLGILQPLELSTFDQLLRLRPDEKPETRLLVVKITEEDVQLQSPEERRGSLTDESLFKLLTQLEAYQPRAIGLDIYRDYPVRRKLPQLAALMQKSDRLIAVCRVSDPQSGRSGILPPPEVLDERLGFSDVVVDPDSVIRRHLLSLTPPPSSPCIASYAFSVQLALRYLAAQGISLKFKSDGAWKLGKTTFKPLEDHASGYQGIDASGYQILLNYRSHRSLETFVPQVTLAEVLAGKINASAVQDRIVLIGTTAESFQDSSFTPYTTNQGATQKIPGVILQAQMISQLLSAAIEGRVLLWTLSLWQETMWIWGWSFIGSILAYYARNLLYFGIAIGLAIITLYNVCLLFLILWGAWIPLLPSAIALVSSSSIIISYLRRARATHEKRNS
ncbi:MAG: CHASE2 domain-containing protein [Scytonema sp. PMC 1069.18]|nr:CHASE2 domain-containing protein [Scytonema sp. PMC 1069.18]MEC4881807.1 CHASE2 domain-containing protein [Scytonema sp. PMC 1070.18]